MNTRRGKNKGKRGQNEVRDMILKHFTDLEEGDVKSTTMGESGVDIQLSPKALTQLPLSVEVKRRKTFATVYNWYDQANRNDGNEPIVFFRGDHKKWLVMVDAEHYIKLLSETRSLKAKDS